MSSVRWPMTHTHHSHCRLSAMEQGGLGDLWQQTGSRVLSELDGVSMTQLFNWHIFGTCTLFKAAGRKQICACPVSSVLALRRLHIPSIFRWLVDSKLQLPEMFFFQTSIDIKQSHTKHETATIWACLTCAACRLSQLWIAMEHAGSRLCLEGQWLALAHMHHRVRRLGRLHRPKL